jgi:hypothetical protein
LVNGGNHKDAVELAFALPGHLRDSMHTACQVNAEPGSLCGVPLFALNFRVFVALAAQVDFPFIGEGTVMAAATTPQSRGAASTPIVTSSIQLHHQDDVDINGDTPEGGSTGGVWLKVHSSSTKASSSAGRRIPVVGFSLDGAFVLADAPLRCHDAMKLDDGSGEDGLHCEGGSSGVSVPTLSFSSPLLSNLMDRPSRVWVPGVREALLELAPALERAAAGRSRMNRQVGLDTKRRLASPTMMEDPLIPTTALWMLGNESAGISMGAPPVPLISPDLVDATTNYAVSEVSLPTMSRREAPHATPSPHAADWQQESPGDHCVPPRFTRLCETKCSVSLSVELCCPLDWS